eukprot:CAMPEP_0174239194 /NCGR_PEP_ID=MMETSP0417-20130205/13799_1 /TAXON_ID=242541 /ORGANISM="Mayorella sp, Strain BSH-02190019" /LENGTH=386 /DNA_ID=CAMNT_0015318109 /DNA_START=26 /DNA_END=1183 /DNA_ORIENTATION=-
MSSDSSSAKPAHGSGRGVLSSLPWMDFLRGGLATSAATLFTNPLEVIKVRMQVQGELQRRLTVHASATSAPPPALLYRNAWQGLGVIWRAEGLRGVQKGLMPAVAYQFSMNGIRLGTYSVLKSALDIESRTAQLQSEHREQKRREKLARELRRGAGGSPADPQLLHSADEEANQKADRELMWAERARYYGAQAVLGGQRIAAGAGAGVLGAVVASPLYLVKTRMQVSSPVNPSVGAQRNYSGMRSALREVYKEGGVRELWRGSRAASLRVAGGSSAQLGSYDWCKSTLQYNTGFSGAPLHLLASLYSGVFVVLVMNPFDVVSTRIYNQPIVDGRGTLYEGVADCFRKTVRTEGMRGLYKGVIAHWLRVGPHTCLTFVFLEQLRSFW